ncbi:hypothetical protein ACJMK2_028468 [Sinanodonta woodiana]|uniref:G-protein coupled receptors family 2 profile 2 domain-containing protein n=1 Tax=Sinanodonta woodiana TaxID=1069815 RepID=A0ABD3XAS4_SINWO
MRCSYLRSHSSPSEADMWSTFHTSAFQQVDKSKLMRHALLVLGAWRFCDTSFARSLFRASVPDVLSLYDYTSLSEVCSCSDSCMKSGYCCPDVPWGYIGRCIAVTAFSFGRNQNDSDSSYLMVVECPINGNVSKYFKNDCTDNHSTLEPNDIHRIPVTSNRTMGTYKNVYCALCQGERKSDLIQWELETRCERYPSDFNFLSNRAEVLSMMQSNNCTMYYAPPSGISLHLTSCRTNLISRCNVSGLWHHYDPDLEWGCEHLNLPYGRFKNIFCYICNPSVASLYKPVYNKCNVTGLWSKYDKPIENACKKIPRHTRLGPIKNVYCALCNGLNMSSSALDPIGTGIWIPQMFVPKLNIKQRFHLDKLEVDKGVFHQSNERISLSEDSTRILLSEYLKICSKSLLCENVKFGGKNNQSDLNPLCGKCSCNDSCIMESTCCLDKYLSLKPYSIQRDNTMPAGVINTPSERLYISKCFGRDVPNWIRARCETPRHGTKDLLQLLPVIVTSSHRNMFSKNVYCSVCNGENRFIPVSVDISCKANVYLEPSLLTDPNALQRVTNRYHCNTSFASNDFNKGRKVVTTCVISQNVSVVVLDACERPSVQLMLMPEVYFNYTTYRNIFCLLCNIQTASEFVIDGCKMIGLENIYNDESIYMPDSEVITRCHEDPLDSTWRPFRNRYCYLCNLPSFDMIHRSVFTHWHTESSYRALFSIGTEDWTRFIRHSTNNINNDVNRENNVSKSLRCAPGRVLDDDGRCITILESTTDLFYQLYFGLRVTRETTYSYSQTFHNSTSTPTVLQTLHALKETIHWTIGQSLTTLDLEVLSPCSEPYNVLYNRIILFQAEFQVSKVSNRSALEEKLLNSRTSTYYVNVRDKILHLKSFITNERLTSVEELSDASDNVCRIYLTFNGPDMLYSDKNYIRVRNAIKCPLTVLPESQYVSSDSNDSVLILKTGKIVSEEDFLRLNSSVFICLDTYTLVSEDVTLNYGHLPPISVIHNVFSHICTLLSVTCLFITFVTYTIFQQLRTVPGVDIMLLVACLFVAQTLLEFGLLMQEPIVCEVLGILINYFWMCTFCAFNVCSFHMYQVFSSSNPVMRKQRYYITRHALYVFLAPLVVVLFTVGSYLIISEGRNVGYGGHVCFLSDSLTIAIAFLLPVTCLSVSNIVFLSLTFHAIRKTPKVRRRQNDRRRFIIYVKLCAITGVAWPLMIVDASLSLSVFSFFATFVNALQGVFIFISYVCNKRVYELYKQLRTSIDNKTRRIFFRSKQRSVSDQKTSITEIPSDVLRSLPDSKETFV